MDLNLLLNEAIGGRSGRRGGMLERLMRSFLWSAVNQAMSTALETATAPVQTRTESRAAAAMETATAVPPPVTLPPAREAFEQVARPERRKSTWDREIERIQLEVTAELETMQPTLGRTPEQFDDVKPYILRTILDTLQEGRQKGMSATDLQRFITPSALIAAADHGSVEEQPRFAAYNLPSDIPERVRMNLTDVNFDRPQEGYRAVRDIPVPFGPQFQPDYQPRAAETPEQREEAERQTQAEQAMEEAARATSRNTEATEQLQGPLTALKLAILSMLGFSRNAGVTVTGGGMRGGGNSNQPPAAPPPDDNQGGNRPNRRPSMFRRIMRRGPRRAITRAGAMLGGGVARLAGGNAMAGAAAGARLGAGIAGAAGGPVGIAFVALAVITGRVVSQLRRLATASWETTMRVGQWSGQLTGARAILEVNRTLRDIQLAQQIAPGGAQFIKEQNRFEKNMMPLNRLMTDIGNWAGTTGLRMLNGVLETVVNPVIEHTEQTVAVLTSILDMIMAIAPNADGVAAGVADMLGVARDAEKARIEREAAERLKELQEMQAAIAPQMNNINAMMNDLAAGRRPF